MGEFQRGAFMADRGVSREIVCATPFYYGSYDGTSGGDTFLLPGTVSSWTGWSMPRAGRVMGISLQADTAFASGESCTITVYKGATALSTAKIEMTSGTRNKAVSFTWDQALTFPADAVLRAHITHTANTTAILGVSVQFAQ